jgi:hypothetical protein
VEVGGDGVSAPSRGEEPEEKCEGIKPQLVLPLPGEG